MYVAKDKYNITKCLRYVSCAVVEEMCWASTAILCGL